MIPPVPADPRVTDYGRCTAPDVDPEMFFSFYGARDDEAREVCRHCMVRGACLTEALRCGPGLQGVWAGTTQRERKKLLKARKLQAVGGGG